MADIHIIEPYSHSNLRDKEEKGNYHSNHSPDKIPDHLTLIALEIMVQAETQHENHQSVSRVDFNIGKTERGEGQISEYDQFQNIDPGKKPRINRSYERPGIRNHNPFYEVDPDHADGPTRKFPLRRKRIQESMSDQSTPESGHPNA